jgi:hypothetical protein
VLLRRLHRVALACTAAAFVLAASGISATAQLRRAPASSAVKFPLPVRPPALAPFGFSGLRARFEHSLICDDGILIANYARRYGVSTIYVQLGGDDVGSLLARNPTTVKNLQAMIAVANVYLVVGDPTWLGTPTTVPAAAISAASIAKVFPQVAGVLYDVDPAATTAWNSNQRQTLVSAYLTLVNTLTTMPGAASFKSTQFVGDVQYATTHPGGNTKGPTLLQDVEAMPGVSGFALQVPGNSAAAQLANAGPSLAQLTLPFSIVAGESKYAPNSYNGVSAQYLQANLAQVAQTAAQLNANFTGITADGWNDLYNGLSLTLPQPPVFNNVLASGPLVPPPGSIYLGGYVNAAGTGPTPYQTTQFERKIGRTLAFDLHFYGWKQYFPTTDERQDVARGRIPIIAWNCSNHGDYEVAQGEDDALIAQRAAAVKRFGSPVIIRWFWEMNLNDLNNPPRTQCWDPKTDLPDGYFSPVHYIGAWRHIHAIFASLGVTNVVWEWCVANAHGGPSQYYPGDDVVDWVGMDDYDTNDIPLANMLYIPANEISQFQEKPVMLTETGAHVAYQAPFFTGTAAFLQAAYPWIRGIGYFDSKGTAQDWVLSGSGLTTFDAFASDPYLSAMSPTP